jgi:hypothetical protein
MNAHIRAALTIVAAGIGGTGLWLAGHFDRTGTGGYWAALGVIAAAGLLLAAAQLRARDGDPRAMLVAFAVVLVTGGWVLLAAQPDSNWIRDHVRAWNADIGIADVVHYVMVDESVVAFAIGAILGYTLVQVPGRIRVIETAAAPAPPAPSVNPPAADEPTTAEQEETAVTAAVLQPSSAGSVTGAPQENRSQT